MRCWKCKKKVKKVDGLEMYFADKKGEINKVLCESCVKKRLKTARCMLCDCKIERKAFATFKIKNKQKFLCLKCVNIIKKLRVK